MHPGSCILNLAGCTFSIVGGVEFGFGKENMGWLWTDEHTTISLPECICRLALFLWGKQGSLIVLPLPRRTLGPTDQTKPVTQKTQNMKLGTLAGILNRTTVCLPIVLLCSVIWLFSFSLCQITHPNSTFQVNETTPESNASVNISLPVLSHEGQILSGHSVTGNL